MKAFFNLKVGVKLLAGFIFVALIAGVVGIVGITNIIDVEKNAKLMYEDNTIPLSLVDSIALDYLRTRIEGKNIVIVKSSEDRKASADKIKELDKNIDSALKDLKEKYFTTQIEKNGYAETENLYGEYRVLRDKYIDLAINRMDEQALQLLSSQVAPLGLKVEDSLQNLSNIEKTQSKQIVDSNAEKANKTVTAMVIIIALGVIAAVIFGIFLSSLISNPLKKVVEMIEEMSKGHLGKRLKINHKDEFGVVAETMNHFADDLQNVVVNAMKKIAEGDLSSVVTCKDDADEVSPALAKIINSLKAMSNEVKGLTAAAADGKLDTRGNLSNFKGGYAEIIKGINDTLDAVINPINEAMDVMNKIAVNDFTHEMTGSYKGVMEEFSKEVNVVRGRLLSVQDVAIKVSKGDISRLEEFVKIGKRSENDMLMPSFTRMMSVIKELIEEVELISKAGISGKLDIRGNANKFEGGYHSIVDGINSTIDAMAKPLNDELQVLDRMSNNDFTSEMQENYEGAFYKLACAVNGVQKTLNQVLSEINNASEQVAAGSKQVAAASQHLSQGSTEQATSIEELTSAMEQIGAQTKQNALNANKADQLAIEAKDNAVMGNEQMKGLIKSMEGINESSSSISKIIKVIDEIAFQTNILALNAAVEAARAGQHGKGFAVVAEEVRNLAARSAKAAKETSALIEGSIKKVEGGTKIANDTAAALVKIVESVSNAANLVGDIAVASSEQATGISQVNEGIIQVSQVTQTISATAEESAASSEELSSQAELLKEMVGKFELREDTKSYGMYEQIDPKIMKMIESRISENNANNVLKNKTGRKNENTAKSKIMLSDNEFGKY